jgi:ASC-1-like (ASCH) protein
MTHTLKTNPEYFKAIASGDKKFELRKDDRPYQIGDKLILQEYNPETNQYTGQEQKFSISYILNDAPCRKVKSLV